MPRNNKVTERVFASIAETSRQKGAYEKFLAIDKEMGLRECNLIRVLKDRYTEVIRECVNDINHLAALEEIITQIRAKEVIESELRLSLNNGFIYARSTFYRRDTKMNDIRVTIAKVEEYGDDINELIKDTNFRITCKEKLLQAMDKEIEDNVKQLNLNFIYNERTI